MMKNRKPPTEAEAKEWLQEGRLDLIAVRLKFLKDQPRYRNDQHWDFEVKAFWNKQSARFAVEHKSLSTPKVFEEAVRICLAAKLPEGCYPMILMPYLRRTQIEELARDIRANL